MSIPENKNLWFCVFFLVLCIDGVEEMYHMMLDVQYNIVYVYIYD